MNGSTRGTCLLGENLTEGTGFLTLVFRVNVPAFKLYPTAGTTPPPVNTD